MKKYKFKLISTERLIDQISSNADRLKQTRAYIEYTIDAILDLFKKIKDLNMKLSKLEVEEKSLKHDTYEITDVQKEKEDKRNELNRILEVGLNDFILKVDLLIGEVKIIYVNCLTLLYKKYKSASLIELKEEIKDVVRGIYESDEAMEETVITNDIFNGEKVDISGNIKKEASEIEKFEEIGEVKKELEDIEDILVNISVLIPKVEEAVPKIESEIYLLDDITEKDVVNKIKSVKVKISKIKKFIDEQAKLLHRDIRIK